MKARYIFAVVSVAAAAAVATAGLVMNVAAKPNIAGSDQAKEPPAPPAVKIMEPVTDAERQSAAAHVKRISDGKASVSEVFRGPGGYLGVVVDTGDSKFVAWMTPARDALFVGAMFDQNGKNVTQAEMLARGYAKTDNGQGSQLPQQAAIKRAVDSTASFIEGTSGPLVTAFIDFNCGFCRMFYQRSRPFVQRGAMRIRWVPVAILQEDSAGKAATVMSSVDPVAAVTLMEENRLTAQQTVPLPLQQRIGGNTAVLNLLGGGNPGTPTLLVQKRDGTYNISPGMPQDLGSFIATAGS